MAETTGHDMLDSCKNKAGTPDRTRLWLVLPQSGLLKWQIVQLAHLIAWLPPPSCVDSNLFTPGCCFLTHECRGDRIRLDECELVQRSRHQINVLQSQFHLLIFSHFIFAFPLSIKVFSLPQLPLGRVIVAF